MKVCRISICDAIMAEFLQLGNEEDSGKVFQVLGGWASQARWQRTGGHSFPVNKPLQPEDIIAKWNIITDFGKIY